MFGLLRKRLSTLTISGRTRARNTPVTRSTQPIRRRSTRACAMRHTPFRPPIPEEQVKHPRCPRRAATAAAVLVLSALLTGAIPTTGAHGAPPTEVVNGDFETGN